MEEHRRAFFRARRGEKGPPALLSRGVASTSQRPYNLSIRSLALSTLTRWRNQLYATNELAGKERFYRLTT